MQNGSSKAPAGIFTVSLDFELYWGTRDHRSLGAYGANVLGGREAIPRILSLFERFGIHATWATVGLVFFDGPKDAQPFLPLPRPEYMRAELSPYRELERVEKGEVPKEYFFAPALVEKIRSTPGQEIGSHTFSHYYCLESGQTREAFAADAAAIQAAARKKLGTEIRSLVFPRNQTSDSYCELSREAGIRAFRGNPRSWLYEAKAEEDETLVRRGLRLLDSYVNLTGHHAHRLQDLKRRDLADVRASRFLRPYSRKLRALEPLRLRRIRDDLTHAARTGGLYHLWWHPENFGKNADQNLEFLTRVLEHFDVLRITQGMRSLHMGEVADLLDGAAA